MSTRISFVFRRHCSIYYSWLSLGGGVNGYLFSYYGFLRPDILIGCLFPQIPMVWVLIGCLFPQIPMVWVLIGYMLAIGMMSVLRILQRVITMQPKKRNNDV